MTLLLAPAADLYAQPITPTAARPYAGPRFPGGPDSLQVLLSRAIRFAASTATGRMLVQFELKDNGQPTNYSLIRPPMPLNKPLIEATAHALDYIEAHMPAWQPAPPVPPAPGARPDGPPKITLLLDFPQPDAPVMPYAYADENPVFATLDDVLRQQKSPFPYVKQLLADSAGLNKLRTTPEGLLGVLQMQVRYPVDALRANEQGTVYAYLEISPDGTIAQREVLGSAGRALDAEVRRVMASLPKATAPARLHGQPVRLYYVLPIRFVRV